jgi:solute:Na+ symporter, SSS family
MSLTPVDHVIPILHFLFVLGIGWRLCRSVASAGEFLTAGHAVPVWITSLAFLAANLGAQEVVGMCASGAIPPDIAALALTKMGSGYALPPEESSRWR